ncbi:hypothetical protein FRC04_002982 [Tulasnella sp. 424]|nr:hypothetical protein FRC04_002982 [Tulasnella sp. 424]KAG8981213.1 hypothetical protein FRC05_004115 [Tulasnella sp. 425]
MSSDSASYPTATPERAEELGAALDEVRARVRAAAESRSENSVEPRLVAVSKYKPAADIMACYQHGQRDFGENYAAELAEKAAVLPKDIRWHFIGGLQSNKCKPLAAIPNIYAIQTVDSGKKATALNKSLPAERETPLNIYIQVNTSGEDQKSGITPLKKSEPASTDLVELAKLIIQDCPRLRLAGLMTIGSFEASTGSDEENPDFKSLVETKEALTDILRSDSSLSGEWGVNGDLELSMGMSADFELAIRAGSGSVRVGTGIFGSRPPK